MRIRQLAEASRDLEEALDYYAVGRFPYAVIYRQEPR